MRTHSFAFAQECGADFTASEGYSVPSALTEDDNLKIALRILGLKQNSVAEACFQITLASCKNID